MTLLFYLFPSKAHSGSDQTFVVAKMEMWVEESYDLLTDQTMGRQAWFWILITEILPSLSIDPVSMNAHT